MAEAKKRQRFFDVDMPILKKETQLYGFALEDLKDRYIKYDLTRFLRGKSMVLRMKVKITSDAGGTKAFAEPIEAIVLPYFIRRMMRKGTNYVEDSFSTECKNAVLTIKPFLITRKKVSRAVQAALRNKAREELIAYVKNKDANVLFEDLMRNNIQKHLSLVLKKIYPLSMCEIRIFKVEKEIKS